MPEVQLLGEVGLLTQQGVGRGLPGVMLETQHINVPACWLYERCGFVLGGFDTCLYRSVMPGTREIATFWHRVF